MQPDHAPRPDERTVRNLCRATGIVAIGFGVITLLSLLVTASDEVLSEYASGFDVVLSVLLGVAYLFLGAVLAGQADGVFAPLGSPEARRSWGLVIALFVMLCVDLLLSCLGALGLSELADEAEFLYGEGSEVHSAFASAVGWAYFVSFLVIGGAVLALVTLVRYNGIRKATAIAPARYTPAGPPPAPGPRPAPRPPLAPARPDLRAEPPAPPTREPTPDESATDVSGTLAQLRELSNMLDKGHLSREEFERLKSGVLAPAEDRPEEDPASEAEPASEEPDPEAEPESGAARRGVGDDLIDD